MKKIFLVLFVLVCAKVFCQSKTVAGFDPLPGAKFTFNSLVAKDPWTITTGGGTDTGQIRKSFIDSIRAGLFGSGSGGGLSNGTYPRLPMWINASTLSGGYNVNADTANTRMGFGTATPTHTITLDSPRSASGIAMYATGDQTTNYQRLHMYTTPAGFYLTRESGGTAPCCTNLYLSSNSGAYVTYNGAIATIQLVCSGTVQGGILVGPEARWDHSRTNTGNGTNAIMGVNDLGSYNSSSAAQTGVLLGGASQVSQTGTAGFTGVTLPDYWNTAGSGVNKYIQIGVATPFFTVYKSGSIAFAATNTTTGTTGAQTINKASGTVNIAAGGTSVTVTNSLVTTSSIVYAVIRTNDANATSIKSVVPASGSFTININTAPAAEISVGFVVFN